ncbi:MAG TPA: hypothetical protein VGZ00_10350 [Candidatus Baltobacteraceae bacterium]|nr:hypothetical protein [Candidatus Baltobacteraceae bacterium]
MPLFPARFLASVTPVALCAILAATSAVSAAPCSSDRFEIDSQAITVQVCAPTLLADANTGLLPLIETISTAQNSISQTLNVHVLAHTAHAINDVSLEPLGIHRLLHLAISYNRGAARLDHALLIPSALPLK